MNRREAFLPLESRKRLQQAYAVRMERVLQDFSGGCDFDNVSRIHDGHLLAQVSDDREVVTDNQHRQIDLAIEFF